MAKKKFYILSGCFVFLAGCSSAPKFEMRQPSSSATASHTTNYTCNGASAVNKYPISVSDEISSTISLFTTQSGNKVQFSTEISNGKLQYIAIEVINPAGAITSARGIYGAPIGLVISNDVEQGGSELYLSCHHN